MLKILGPNFLHQGPTSGMDSGAGTPLTPPSLSTLMHNTGQKFLRQNVGILFLPSSLTLLIIVEILLNLDVNQSNSSDLIVKLYLPL